MNDQNPYSPNNPYPPSNPYSPPSYPPIPSPTSSPQSYPPIPAPPSSHFPAPTPPFDPLPTQSMYPSTPYSGLAAPQPEKPRKSPVKLILIIAAVLMFAAAGTFAGLYVAADGDHEKATSTLEDKKAELADVKKEVTSAEEAKSTAEETNSDLEEKNSALTPCVEATQHFLYDDMTEAETDVAVDAMFAACG
jgi:hypothetical protein